MSTAKPNGANKTRLWILLGMGVALFAGGWLADAKDWGRAEEKQSAAITANAEEIVDVQEDLGEITLTVKALEVELKEQREIIYKNQKEILQAINSIGTR